MPSHLNSTDHPGPAGGGPGVASIGNTGMVIVTDHRGDG